MKFVDKKYNFLKAVKTPSGNHKIVLNYSVPYLPIAIVIYFMTIASFLVFLSRKLRLYFSGSCPTYK